LIDLVDCWLHQADRGFAMSAFVVFSLLKFTRGLLQIVSGGEHVLLVGVGASSAKDPEG
jgi:hypothetical protein